MCRFHKKSLQKPCDWRSAWGMDMFFLVALSVLMAVVVVEDARRYTIPNWLNLLVLALFVPHAFYAELPLGWLMHFAGFGAFFIVGFVLFATRMMGGGDVKLLAALGLWCGWGAAGGLLALYTCLFGGLLAIALLILRKILPYLQARSGRVWKLPLMCIDGQPIPYGLAIAAGFLVLLYSGSVAGLAW